MKSTYFALFAEFGTADIPLEKAGPKYFGLDSRKAGDMARRQKLPVPAYRCGSQKSQWLINAHDLAEWIDKRRNEANKDWERMNDVA